MEEIMKKTCLLEGFFPVLCVIFLMLFILRIHVPDTCLAAGPSKQDPAKVSPIKLDPARLKPGLAVIYFPEFWGRHLDELFSGEEAELDGKPGDPIPYLNHKFGEKQVFGSGKSRGVGVQMDGYLNMAEAGEYWFKAFANDGIRVYLNKQLIVDDPSYHIKTGDRFSEPLQIEIEKPGWYPVRVRYFQRKGTATLQLYWKPPGAGEYRIIPPEAYAHAESQIKKN
jgi:hypothetical protein